MNSEVRRDFPKVKFTPQMAIYSNQMQTNEAMPTTTDTLTRNSVAAPNSSRCYEPAVGIDSSILSSHVPILENFEAQMAAMGQI